MKERVAKSRTGSRLLRSTFLLLGIAVTAAAAAPLGWPFELFVHFRLQYAAAAVALAVLLAWQRHHVLALAALLVAAWQGLPPAQRALAAEPGACGGPSFTVVTANLRYRNLGQARFVDWLRTDPADLLVVQEVTPDWERALGALPGYPHRYLLARADPYGIGVLSRWPLESVSAVDFAGDGLPSLTGLALIEGRPVRFIGMHTHWPILPALARARDVSLRRAAAAVRADRLPTVLLGDLNLTPDAPVFARLLDESGLRDTVAGPRWQPTWQAGFWPLALRIDHVLVSRELCVDRAQVGPSIGSDHRPVIARLRLGPERTGPVSAGAMP